MYHVEVGRGTCVTVRVWDRVRVRVRVKGLGLKG